MKNKVSFNKASVILMYLMIIGLFLFCFITTAYPPIEFTICWFIFWIAQAIITCVLQINKRKVRHKTEEKELKVRLIDALAPYFNEENANELIKKYVGIEPVYKETDLEKKGGKK